MSTDPNSRCQLITYTLLILVMWEVVCIRLRVKEYKFRSTKVVRKLRTFCHKKILIDNRKETEYTFFITHLHLLLHIVTLDTEALVVP